MGYSGLYIKKDKDKKKNWEAKKNSKTDEMMIQQGSGSASGSTNFIPLQSKVDNMWEEEL